MAIVELEDAKRHLRVDFYDDDMLIDRKIQSAQAHIESWLGYAIEDRFEEPPADLHEAVLSLMAHLFENREASVVGVTITSAPLSVRDVISARRDYATGD